MSNGSGLNRTCRRMSGVSSGAEDMLTQIAIRVTPSTSRSSRAAGREQHGSSDNNSLLESMHLMGAVVSYKRNTEIFGEDEPADYIYKVISGSVRTYKSLSDGRRQICGFLFARRLLLSALCMSAIRWKIWRSRSPKASSPATRQCRNSNWIPAKSLMSSRT